MQPGNSNPRQIHLFPPTSCQPSLSDSTKSEREGMKRKTGRHELFSLLISFLPASVADDHKQGTHTLSYHTDNFIFQSLHQHIIMEHQLPSFRPSGLQNTWEAQNRPMLDDFRRRLGKQVQQGK